LAEVPEQIFSWEGKWTILCTWIKRLVTWSRWNLSSLRRY